MWAYSMTEAGGRAGQGDWHRVANGLALGLVLALAGAGAARATTHHVTTKMEFDDALAIAEPGDQIVVANGTYSDWGQVVIDRGGDVDDRLVIRGANASQVVFDGNSSFFIEASHLELRDMTLRGQEKDVVAGASTRGNECCRGPVVWVFGYPDTLLEDFVFADLVFDSIRTRGIVFWGPVRDVLIEQNDFVDSGDPDCADNSCGDDWAHILLWGDGIEDFTIKRNEFIRYESTPVHVSTRSKENPFDPPPVDILVKNNDFVDGSTQSAIQLGTNGPDAPMHVKVKGNLFLRHDSYGTGGTELIEVKSSANEFVQNRFIDCKGHVSNRGGSDNVYDRNYFLRSEPQAIRIIDSDNLVSNNVILGGRFGIRIESQPGQEADRAAIVNNMLIGQSDRGILRTQTSLVVKDEDGNVVDTIDPEEPVDVVVANNVLSGRGGRLVPPVIGPGAVVARNVFHVTSDPGNVDPVDPRYGTEPFFADPFAAPLPADLDDLDEEDPFGSGSLVVGRGLHMGSLGVTEDYLKDPRPAGRGGDIGHLEAGGDDCPDPGDATVTLTASPGWTIQNGGTLALDASSVADPQGLGYPIFWDLDPSGFTPIPFTHVWDFNPDGSGDATPTTSPLQAFTADPSITIDKGAITEATLHTLHHTTFDQWGCETLTAVEVTVEP